MKKSKGKDLLARVKEEIRGISCLRVSDADDVITLILARIDQLEKTTTAVHPEPYVFKSPKVDFELCEIDHSATNLSNFLMLRNKLNEIVEYINTSGCK